MTSVVDKYYRIIQNIDNVRMKFDISALLVKSKEHDSKIDTNKNNIAENLTLINSRSDIIEDNKDNIAETLTLINSKFETNKNNISDNLKLINTKSALIEDNKSNITNNYNISQINKKKSEFNTTLIDNNKNDISENLKLINSKSDIIEDNENNISENLTLINSKSDIIEDNKNNISENFKKINELIALLKSKIPKKIFKKIYNIVKRKFNFNRTLHYHEIFLIDIENNFTKYGELRFSSKIDYKYVNLRNDITRLCHEYQLYTKDGLIHTLVYNHKDFSSADYTNNIL